MQSAVKRLLDSDEAGVVGEQKKWKKEGKRSAISRQLSAMAGSAIVIAFQDGVEIFVFWLKADS
jgi:hypothetical protein